MSQALHERELELPKYSIAEFISVYSLFKMQVCFFIKTLKDQYTSSGCKLNTRFLNTDSIPINLIRPL